VLGTVRDACRLHPMVHDYRMTEAVENLAEGAIESIISCC